MMRVLYVGRKGGFGVLALLACLLALRAAAAEDKPAEPQAFRHQITGLFSPDRVEDLREVALKIPNLHLVGVDYENAEATFAYDPATLFPGAKPEQYTERLDNLLRSNSHSTFGARPLRETPKEKLTLVEIPVLGLDCKGCCLAAYEIVYRIDGVEQATASFRDGRVTALIDVAKTNRAALAAALQRQNVTLAEPEKK